MNLIVLAAGLGTRFGGPKQFFPVGPNGECLFHYSVWHALSHGFTRLILVTRVEIITQAEAAVSRIPIPVEVILQETPGGKPRGTADALLTALKQSGQGQSAIVNGDDYYGGETFAIAAELAKADPPAAAVPYSLGETLSKHGGVSRAICQIEEGFLTSIRETHGLSAFEGGASGSDEGVSVQIPLSTPVSMNFFLFSQSVSTDLAAFVDGAPLDIEATIPDFLNERISRANWRIPAKVSNAEWFGMTYAEDLPAVRKKLAEFHQNGKMPHRLW